MCHWSICRLNWAGNQAHALVVRDVSRAQKPRGRKRTFLIVRLYLPLPVARGLIRGKSIGEFSAEKDFNDQCGILYEKGLMYFVCSSQQKLVLHFVYKLILFTSFLCV